MLPFSYAGIVLPKHTPLKSMFEPIVRRLREGGIIDQYTKSYYYYWKPEVEEDELFPIGILHLIIPVSVYFVGLFIAFVAFMVEKCYHRVVNTNPVV